MGERSQVLAGPLAVACPVGPGHLAALVAADVFVRRARAAGWSLPAATAVVAGGRCHQYATEEALAREGLDRGVVGRHAFEGRAEQIRHRATAHLAGLAVALGLDVDVDEAGQAGEESARAACVAFVRLFEAGLVVEAERVTDVCPRCGTVACGPDALPGVVDGEALVLRLNVLDGPDAVGWLDVRCVAPELVQGVVAVAVPEGHPAAGGTVAVPVAAAVVPVVADPAVDEPVLVVPAHDAQALELARRAGIAAVAVVDTAGTVRAPGPLEGLARHAARAAARRLLAAEGVVVGVGPAAEPVARCAACRTVVVPVLGRHWFLAMGDLEVAAADAVRDGRLTVSPAAARDEMLALAGASPEWCLSRQRWVGQPLPAARCADCGSVDVSVERPASCRRCMGDAVAEEGVLDARFVSCIWPLWFSGWADGGRRGGEAATTTLVVAADGLADALAMAALGLRLGGEVPFAEVLVAPAGGEAGGADPGAVDVIALVEEEGRGVVRVALVCGGLDLAAGRDLVAGLDPVPAGDADVHRLDEACAAALDAGTPAAAVGLLATALAEGVPADATACVRALAAPFVGG